MTLDGQPEELIGTYAELLTKNDDCGGVGILTVIFNVKYGHDTETRELGDFFLC